MTTDNTSTSGQVGAGQQTPNDPASEVNKIAFAVRQMLARLDTMKLVKVMAFHPGSGSPPTPGTVDVLPLVQQADGNQNAVSHGTVYGIPCKRIQGGPWSIICDPAEGDIGYVVASDRDIAKVKATSAEAPPGSLRKFSIADGVYEGGVLNPVSPAYLWLKSDGTFKLVDQAGFVLQTDGSGNATITGTLKVTGDVIANSAVPGAFVSLLGHEHPTAALGPPSPPTPGT